MDHECSRCSWAWRVNTWDNDPETGEQGYRTNRYSLPDEDGDA